MCWFPTKCRAVWAVGKHSQWERAQNRMPLGKRNIEGMKLFLPYRTLTSSSAFVLLLAVWVASSPKSPRCTVYSPVNECFRGWEGECAAGNRNSEAERLGRSLFYEAKTHKNTIWSAEQCCCTSPQLLPIYLIDNNVAPRTTLKTRVGACCTSTTQSTTSYDLASAACHIHVVYTTAVLK